MQLGDIQTRPAPPAAPLRRDVSTAAAVNLLSCTRASSLLATHTSSSARGTMVDRLFYPADARRYSRGGPLLPPSFTERHRYPALSQETRPSPSIMGDRDSGVDAPTRKRISVAVSLESPSPPLPSPRRHASRVSAQGCQHDAWYRRLTHYPPFSAVDAGSARSDAAETRATESPATTAGMRMPTHASS